MIIRLPYFSFNNKIESLLQLLHTTTTNNKQQTTTTTTTMSEQSGETKEVENKKDSAKRLGRNIVEMKYEKNEDCPVCLREMKNTTVQHTLCGHTFHSSCLEQQFTSEFNNNNKCALCRKEITDEKKTGSTSPTRPRDENERDFNDSFINTYSDLTDMFTDTYKLNAKITEKGSIDDDDKEMMRELKENISSCSTWLIEHLQSANDIHVQGTQVVQGTNDTQETEVEEKDVDIETLLMIVENTYVSVLNAINHTIPLISNTFSHIGQAEFKFYSKKYSEIKELYQRCMGYDIDDILRERRNNRENRYIRVLNQNGDEDAIVMANENEDEDAIVTANENEYDNQDQDDSSLIIHDIKEDEYREIVEESEVVQEERKMENNEIIEREQEFMDKNNGGFYIDGKGTLLSGKFKDYKFTGYCHYEYTTGNSYAGDYKDGMLNGYGHYNYKNGNIYYGRFKDGMMDGTGGLFQMANGIKYMGEYKNGKKHGHGRLFIPNGLSFQDFTS